MKKNHCANLSAILAAAISWGGCGEIIANPTAAAQPVSAATLSYGCIGSGQGDFEGRRGCEGNFVGSCQQGALGSVPKNSGSGLEGGAMPSSQCGAHSPTPSVAPSTAPRVVPNVPSSSSTSKPYAPVPVVTPSQSDQDSAPDISPSVPITPPVKTHEPYQGPTPSCTLSPCN